MENLKSNYEWLNERFTPKVEKVLTDYLASKSNPSVKTDDFDNGIISDYEREDYIRYTLSGLQYFWSNPPGNQDELKPKTVEEIEDLLIKRIYELDDGAIVQLEGMGL